MRNVRWSWVVAVALGVTAGIYLPSCGQDNKPEAAQMPEPEGAMGAYPLPRVVGMTGERDNYYHKLQSTRALPTTQWTHVEVKCLVLAVLHEDDGDVHLRVGDGTVQKCGPREYATGQCIVAEARPGTKIPAVKAGDWIIVRGVSRYDRQHNWSEVHPLDSIEVVSR